MSPKPQWPPEKGSDQGLRRANEFVCYACGEQLEDHPQPEFKCLWQPTHYTYFPCAYCGEDVLHDEQAYTDGCHETDETVHQFEAHFRCMGLEPVRNTFDVGIFRTGDAQTAADRTGRFRARTWP